MTNHPHRTVLTPAPSINEIAALVSTSVRRTAVTRRIDPMTSRALACLAHAVEYIEDSGSIHQLNTRDCDAAVEAIRLLKALNRKILAELPDLPERRSMLRMMLDAWERVDRVPE